MPTTDALIAERYRLERVVGRGGMGEVWLAQDVVLGRQVAAKRIGARGASERDLLRARQEARVTAMLDHEHVVRVFDLVVEDGEQWLVMELVESENLARLVRRTGPLDLSTAARLTDQTARALAVAHAAGIVHRDVKPSNLLVTPSWHVKLGDFGIARLEGDVGTTRTGQLVGSPGYLAPEVGIGRSASPASDMWSLGATVFHAVEGHAPYTSDDNNVMATLYRVVNDPPPRMQRGGWLEPLVTHLMVHDPDARWTAAEVVDHLEQAQAQQGRQSRSGSRARPPAPVALSDQISQVPARPAVDPLADYLADTGPDAAATSMLPVVPPPVRAPVPVPQQAAPTPPPPPTRTPPRRRTAPPPRRRSPLLVGALAVLAVLLVAAVAVLALRTNGGDNTVTPPAGVASPSPSPTTATEAGIASFVRDYLSTAPADPSQGFERLTRSYQRESSGLSGYEGFWGKVDTATATRIDPDLAALQVDYDVDYRYDDGSTGTDNVRLQLTLSDGKYLIAGVAP